MFSPGTLVKNTDDGIRELAKCDYTFRVVEVDRMGIAALEVVGHDSLGIVYQWVKDLKQAEPQPEVQEVS